MYTHRDVQLAGYKIEWSPSLTQVDNKLSIFSAGVGKGLRSKSQRGTWSKNEGELTLSQSALSNDSLEQWFSTYGSDPFTGVA